MIPVLRGAVTDRVRKVLGIAHDLAIDLGHEVVCPEHIAIGLLREGEGVAAAVLYNRRVPLDALERGIEAHLAASSSRTGQAQELSWAPASTRVFEQARVESDELGHQYIGTEHLLLALLRDTDCGPSQVLAQYGIRIDDARTEVLRVLQA